MRDERNSVSSPGEGVDELPVHGVMALGVGGKHGEETRRVRRREP